MACLDRYTYDIDSRRPVVVVVVQGQARHSIRTDDDSRVMSVCLSVSLPHNLCD